MTQDSSLKTNKTEPHPPWLIFAGEAPFYKGFKQDGMGRNGLLLYSLLAKR
jgi:hypothetical protein